MTDGVPFVSVGHACKDEQFIVSHVTDEKIYLHIAIARQGGPIQWNSCTDVSAKAVRFILK